MALSVWISAYFSVSLHLILSNNFESLLQINVKTIVSTIINDSRVLMMFCIIELIVASFLLLFSNKNKNIYYSEQVQLTPKIKVPKPVGQGQYGTGWWLDKKDYNKVFKCNVLDRTKTYDKVCFDSGGIITNVETDGKQDKIYYLADNIHTLVVGSSGSGKSRSVIIPTITMLGLAR